MEQFVRTTRAVLGGGYSKPITKAERGSVEVIGGHTGGCQSM
jgi:hypothetical protein